MSEVKVNKISPRTNCGTVTLGDSGDTFTIPAGATITNNGTAAGFGSTGEVSWNTTKITADPGNAVSGVGYFTDTSGGVFNVTLPSSPSAGNVVAVADYANTWDTNNLTIARNGSNIEGAASDFVCNQEGASVTFVYVDATKGWVVTNSGNSTQAFGENFICATGGTITECGSDRIHTFTGPGTFTVSSLATVAANNVVSYMIVAGGAGSGAGGGGAGGFREFKSPVTPYTASPLEGATPITVTAQGYPVVVGAGSAAQTCNSAPSSNGSPSSVFGVTSAGGGGSAGFGSVPAATGIPGGSGGGGTRNGGPRPGGNGNDPSTSPAQGNNGGAGYEGGNYGSGGGGGAGAVGGDSPSSAGGAGGAGVATSITGSPVTRAGGGGGGSRCASGPNAGGAGGGGNGSGNCAGNQTAGTVNTGGGGGGNENPGPAGGISGTTGGSGIVVIRYKFQ
jgi:hypothetical protein